MVNPVAYKSWEAGWLGVRPPKEPPDSLSTSCLQRTGPDTGNGGSVYVEEMPRSCSSSDCAAQLLLKASSLSQHIDQFRLPDETTPVLTGLLTAAPEAATYSDSTPLTSPGRSSATGSPSGLRLGSPASLGCRSSQGTHSQLTSPIFPDHSHSPDSHQAAMQQAQSLFASMLTPPRRPSKAMRGRSEPPCNVALTTPVAGADMAAGGGAQSESRPRRRCLSMDFKIQHNGQEENATPRLTPMNGQMPRFPPAELNSIEQVQANRRRKRLS